jgi:hypothetical protein
MLPDRLVGGKPSSLGRDNVITIGPHPLTVISEERSIM